jgi:beta-lactamase class A
MRTQQVLALGVLSLLTGIGLGYLFLAAESGSPTTEVRATGSLTNPLLECEMGEDTIGSLKRDITPGLTDLVREYTARPSVADVAVYFRDLNNGPVVGIDEKEVFAPASLLKVPMLIAYLKYAEEKPDALDELVPYNAPIDLGVTQKFPPRNPLSAGTEYTARQLLERMIIESDNQALVLLHQTLPPRYQEELYTLLGVDPALITDPAKTLTVKQYSMFFRILFNASFLSREHSEYALELLAKASYGHGIRSVTPQTIIVASKFGERSLGSELTQFHECAIVYYPNHPYLLCVMTRGADTQELIKVIESIATHVYKEIDAQYGR